MEVKKRLQSPSSINTYKQCPRKYYYRYIERLESVPNIHQVRGNIAHKVLEEFFDIDLEGVTDDTFETHLRFKMQFMLLEEWKKNEERLKQFNLSQEQEIFYFEETLLMLMNWLDYMLERIRRKGSPYSDSFKRLTPVREKEYRNYDLYVRGFIDAIEETEDGVMLIDYKTSSSFNMSEEYKLQMGIYALLYKEEHGMLPSKVGIFFLKHKLKLMRVDEELLDTALKEIEGIHKNTMSRNAEDYPKVISRLCRWSTGQCDFYGHCFNGEAKETANTFIKRS